MSSYLSAIGGNSRGRIAGGTSSCRIIACSSWSILIHFSRILVLQEGPSFIADVKAPRSEFSRITSNLKDVSKLDDKQFIIGYLE
jgi:hypothetical protein